MSVLNHEIARELVQNQGSTVIIPSEYTSIAKESFFDLGIEGIWIPSGITTIGIYAFRGNQLTSINLPDSITSIGGGAFLQNNLVSVDLPQNISIISDNAFAENNLTSIDLPDGLKRIESRAFLGNNLTDIDLPDTVEFIWEYAFSSNSLRSVVIPDSLETIHETAFHNNPLEEVSVSKYYDYLSWVPSGVDIVRRENVAPSDILISLDSVNEGTPGNTAVAFLSTTDEYGDSHAYSLVSGEGDDDNNLFTVSGGFLLINSSPDYELKPFYNFRLQTSDKDGATFEKSFQFTVNRNNLTPQGSATSTIARELVQNQGSTVIIPSEYTSIVKESFFDLGIEGIWIPSSITTIGIYAFRGNQLTSINLPDSITSIGGGAFLQNNLVSVDLPQNISIISDNAFAENNLTSIDLPDGLKRIESRAFLGNNLTDIDLPDTVEFIWEYAFSSNSLRSVVIPDSLETIHETAFHNNPLEEVSVSKYYDYLSWVPSGVDIVRRENVAPSDILISLDSVNEGTPGNTAVAFLSTTDEYGDSHAYSLVSGEGDDDNNLFTVSGGFLLINSSPDYELKPFYNFRLQTSDKDGATFEKSFQFTVNDRNDVPIDVSASLSSFNENISDGSAVATLSTVDQDSGDTHSYALVAGEGDADNSAFIIEGDQLKIVESPDFESKSSYSICLQTRDSGGLTLEKKVTFNVNDVNDVPIDISVSLSSFDENISDGSAVATLSTVDQDSGDTHSYALVAGEGDADNSAFIIEGDQLKIVESPDFESKSSYSIRLQTRDSGGLTLEKKVTLNVSDVNEEPLDVSVSASSFDENIAAGSAVATLSTSDPDTGDTHNYALVSGDGDADNSAFIIEDDQLKIVESPDFESKSSYSIRLQTRDSDGLMLEKKVTFNVNGINDVPIDISASLSSFDENISDGSAVATLSSVDQDSGDTHSYALVAGEGDADNSAFIIEGDQLKIVESPDFESKSSYSIRLQTRDSGGLTLEKKVTFNVNDVNEVPIDISVSLSSFDENISDGSAVATLSTSDPDTGDTHNYALVSGDGDADNSAFIIEGDQLKIVESPDFESKSSYSIRLQTRDSGGLTLEKKVTLNVSDVNEEPLDVSVSASSFDENIAAGSAVATLSTSDPDTGDTHNYALVSGDGDADNSAFIIEGDQLKVVDSPDFETKSSYSIRLQTRDSDGLMLEKKVTFNVNDVNDVPVDISVSLSYFDENISDGSAVAALSAVDQDSGDTHSYALVAGEGDADNSAFIIEGDQLKVVDSPDFETKSSYSIRLQTKDSGGLTFDKAFTLSVNDLEEVPVIQSIDDVSTQKKVTTFKIQDPVAFEGQEVDTVIVGTKKKDTITGTSDGEVLAGMKRMDVLKGGKGADGFLFNQSGSFGNKHLDQIKDFDSDDGDSILVDQDVFGLGKKIKLISYGSKKKVKKAAKSSIDFIYHKKKGLLYFNENGKEKGWGDGGLFAKLQGAPELGADDFTIV